VRQPLLGLASHLFRSIAVARRRWYASHPAARRQLTRPVISVGNLSVGGTGKTPVVAALARLLVGMGERPAILSRGYGRQRSREGVVVVSDGKSLKTDVEHAGDEPFMLARMLPTVVVLVSSQRFLAGCLAEAQFDCTVHLLDDGFQHLGLARDVDILIVTGEDLATPTTLPLGRLREPLSAAAAADAVLMSASESLPPEVAAKVSDLWRSFRIDRRIDTPRHVQTCGDEGDYASIPPPGPVFALAGIANPLRFFEDLQRAGWRLTGTRIFADHHQFSPADLAAIVRTAELSGAKAVLMTEKDMVRLSAVPGARGASPSSAAFRIPSPDSRIPFLWVPLHVTLDPAFAPWLREQLGRA
jgi:tetraacyldisaccharide 4'-kinase